MHVDLQLSQNEKFKKMIPIWGLKISTWTNIILSTASLGPLFPFTLCAHSAPFSLKEISHIPSVLKEGTNAPPSLSPFQYHLPKSESFPNTKGN